VHVKMMYWNEKMLCYMYVKNMLPNQLKLRQGALSSEESDVEQSKIRTRNYRGRKKRKFIGSRNSLCHSC
jgi:hypothetical protein